MFKVARQAMKRYVRGQTLGGGPAFAVSRLAIGLLVSMMVYAEVVYSANTNHFTAGLNTTWSNVQSNSESAFGLLAIGIIVLGANTIMGYMG